MSPLSNDKFHSLVDSYPQLKDSYSILSGMGYDLPFSIFGMISGVLCDRIEDPKHKAQIFSGISILWSLASVVQGSVDSYETFVFMRIL